jgi:valyl-tRNA synthetase
MTSEIEARWIAHWDDKHIYSWNPKTAREESYVIDTPPPTVSGALHMGHLMSYSQTDMLARFQRMAGMNVFYPMGFDDNGLPTERLVEKIKQVRPADMSREAFVALCQDTIPAYVEQYRALFRRLALSIDWSQEYRTIDPSSWRISQMSLLDLYHKGHLERRPQPTLWDPADRTALAQADIVEKEVQGVMYRLPFTHEGGDVEIATTRPELLAACVALMCHPSDARMAGLLGKTVTTPLFGVPVPVIADEKVDPEKGTGLVMCCTFGDLTDIEWWRTHNLPLRDIVGKDGRIFGLDRIGRADWPSLDIETARKTAEAITGLNVRKAREAMVNLLREAGLVRGETPVTQMVPSAERSGAPLEILVSAQWVVKLLDKKAELIAKGKQMEWYPAFMEQRFEDWVANLKWDWGISRQRYFGVPVPFWYSRRAGEEGRIIVPRVEDLPVNPLTTPPHGYAMDEVDPDPDVLDTWATSSCTPQINAHGISPETALDPERFARTFPADLRPQAHEIIRTWTFYTVVKAMLHTDQAPFSTMAVSGFCLARDKTKMSKSKGNGIEPVELLDQNGTDVVRYWAASARLGQDTAFSDDVLKIGKRLVTKLRNAARFVKPQLDSFDILDEGSSIQDIAEGRIYCILDLWLLSRLHQVIESATNHFHAYDYTDALEVAERFFFGEFCDNYLELVKGRIYGEIGNVADQLSARLTLGHALVAILHLMAPFLPFAAEEIFHDTFPKLAAHAVSVHRRGGWPQADSFPCDTTALEAGTMAIDVLARVRAAKSERGVSIKTPLSFVRYGKERASELLADDVRNDLKHTVSTGELVIGDPRYDGEHFAVEWAIAVPEPTTN